MTGFATPNLSELLTDLYDSEVNVSLSWFWDAGIDLALGDDLNGYEAKCRSRRWPRPPSGCGGSSRHRYFPIR
jgi:hypothetical protein